MKKGVVALGPTLILVTLGGLISSAIAIIAGMSLVGGLIFHKKITHVSKQITALKFVIILLLMVLVIGTTYLITPKTGNLYLSMLLGTVAFFIILSLLSLNSIKYSTKESITVIGIITAVFLVIAELSVWVASL